MAPLVSILLPVRDGEPYLAEALRSLSAQTFADFEALVVDDGSTDGSLAVARAHAREDDRFRALTGPAGGIVAALERGRGEARGALLARMDADDVALPERLAVQVAALAAERDLVACGCGVEYWPRDRVTDGARRYEAWLNGLVTAELAARDAFVECPIAHPALVARADAIAAVGGWRDPGWPEDHDLVLRLRARGWRFRNVDSVLLRWRDHPLRLSRTSPRYAREAFVRGKVHHLRETLLAGRAGAVVWGAGPVGKSFARELQRQDVRVLAFVEVDPRKLGRTIHGAPVVAVDDAPPDGVALGAVAGAEARSRIREAVATQGRVEGVDFVAVA
ncbi:MAG: glycosyltransferase [Thermoleophilia bacterium]